MPVVDAEVEVAVIRLGGGGHSGIGEDRDLPPLAGFRIELAENIADHFGFFRIDPSSA